MHGVSVRACVQCVGHDNAGIYQRAQIVCSSLSKGIGCRPNIKWARSAAQRTKIPFSPHHQILTLQTMHGRPLIIYQRMQFLSKWHYLQHTTRCWTRRVHFVASYMYTQLLHAEHAHMIGSHTHTRTPFIGTDMHRSHIEFLTHFTIRMNRALAIHHLHPGAFSCAERRCHRLYNIYRAECIHIQVFATSLIRGAGNNLKVLPGPLGGSRAATDATDANRAGPFCEFK